MTWAKHLGTIVWIDLVTLSRDRVTLLLTFALPIAFFSIFVGIFGSSLSGGGMSKVTVALVDEDGSASSARFVQALEREASLRIVRAPKDRLLTPFTRAEIAQLVKDGDASVGVVILAGFGASFPNLDFSGASAAPAVEILADSQANPIAPQVVAGLMQKAAMMGAPDLMIENGIGLFEKHSGALTPEQRKRFDAWLPALRESLANGSGSGSEAEGSTEAASPAMSGLVAVRVVNVQRDHASDWDAFVAFQVAQTAVMFLLFSLAGAAGSLLEEQESGTLDRTLGSRVGMTGLLVGKWLGMAAVGLAQLAVMFLWAWRPFGLELFTPHHLAGWALVSVATAAAGAGFGMVLATACRTRGQLSGVSTIVILVMSAVGGSMFPRFLMSEGLQRIGLVTFNAWALDGYRKVFYDHAPLWRLWPQLAVLSGLTVVFLVAARFLARRWEQA